MRTLLDILADRAQQQEDRVAFLHPERGDAARMTYGQLWSSARSVAAAVRSRAAAGDRVVLAFPTGLEFITAFLGTLASGCIVVPAYPPDARRPERSTERLRAILHDAQPSLILTEPSIAPVIQAQTPTPCLTTASSSAGRDRPFTPSDYAYLQYTSGSTSAPRGVMVAHGNLIANCRFAHGCCGFSSASRLVNWVPQYHDQGLVYGVCQPIYDGFPCVLLAPQTFIERPLHWLEAIARHRATHAGGPNFTYDVAVRKVPPAKRAGLDLSSWTCAYIAGEPVRAATLDAFAAAFAPCGFRRDAFQPSYGLAEATLRVAASPLGQAPLVLCVDRDELALGRVRRVPRGHAAAVTLVGHGPPEREDRRIIVVDPESRSAVGENRVGELWVSGPDVAGGYWNRPDASTATFAARTVDGRGPFLRTGDLGFVSDDTVYIVGRLKDVIIIRGLNHAPQDIELTVEQALPLVRPGCVAAFGVDEGGEERVVVAAEIRDSAPDGGAPGPIGDAGWSYDSMRRALERRLAERHDVALRDLVLVAPSTIPKTSSGKVQRGECRRRYAEGALTPARDRYGFLPGVSYRLRHDLAPAVNHRRRSVAHDGMAESEGVGPPAVVDGALAEFLQPQHPVEVAALFARTPRQLHEQLTRLRDSVDRGWLEPAKENPGAREAGMRLGVTGWRRSESSQLFFVYTGINARLMMPPIDFLTHTGLIDCNVVMFRDRLRDNYLSGISIELPSLDALLAYQRGLLDAAPHVTAAYSVGTSMGALAAIVAGHALGLDAVWAFAPQIVRAASRARPGETWDLRQLLSCSNGITHYHIYFHAGHEPDATFARTVEGLPGVILHPEPGTGHPVVQSLWQRGLLGSIFPGVANRAAPPPRREAVAVAEIGANVSRVLDVVRRTVRTAAAVEWTPTSSLSDYLDSFATIELLAQLEADLGVKLALSELREPDLQTPSSLTAFVQRQVARLPIEA